jgi:hypothetical protein
MNKKKKEKSEKSEEKVETNKTSEAELRSEEFQQGLKKLQEDTEISLAAKLNVTTQGIVPYLELVDIKEDNNETE